jgi:Family of unknown function (DUF6152)
MRRYWISAVVVTAILSGGQSLAHHSGAMFDMTKTVTIFGTVQQFNWTNPHSSFKVLVANSTGTEDVWAVEMGGPNNLVREGWKRTTLKPGDKVTVTVRPLRDGVPGGAYVGIVLADGRSLGDVPKQ